MGEEAVEELLVEVLAWELLVVDEFTEAHWACCSALAVAWSAVVQLAWRHAAAAAWKTVFVQRQVVLVREEQVLLDKESCEQVTMHADWADTPTASRNRVVKMRRGSTIIAYDCVGWGK